MIMKYSHITYIVLLFIGCSVQPLFAQQVINTEKMDRYLEALYEHDRFMGSVAIFEGDELLYSRALGRAEAGEQEITPESIFRTGSITKTFTSALILKLAEEGKLSLDTRLAGYFPGIPNASEITVEHLLRHQSGLVNFTNLPEYPDYYTEPKTREEMLGMFESIGTNFAPGESTEYSNTGYVLLGYIIEEASGESFADVLQNRIAEPLGLGSTYYATRIDTEKGEVHSFRYSDGEWHFSPETDMSIPHAAGGISSTPAETARFYKAMLEGNLLSEQSVEKMTELRDGVGLGMFAFPFYDRTAFGHTGGIDGFHTVAGHFREQDVTFAIFGNGLNYVMNDITIGVLSILFGQEFEIPDFEDVAYIQLPDETLPLYAGTYSSEAFPLDISIFEQAGRLMAQATGQGAFPLDAVSETVMEFSAANIEIVFDEKEDGRYQAFTFSQMGNSFYFELAD